MAERAWWSTAAYLTLARREGGREREREKERERD
jgi:hypothetical protein